jgi:hypothetical protein
MSLIAGMVLSSFKDVRHTSPKAKIFSLRPEAVGLIIGFYPEICIKSFTNICPVAEIHELKFSFI